MDLEAKLELIKRPPTEEIITEEDLRQLIETKEHPEHYIGLEISGLLHLGTLVMTGNKINDLIKAGIKCTIYLADYHSFLNNKLGGSWEDILKAAKYFEEAFKLYCPKAKIVLGSDLYHNNDEYWKDVIRFSKKITLARNLRCITIMGRSEEESLDFGQLLYPPMQGVDIKYLGPDLPHGGSDQRKIHIVARETFPKLGWQKPVALHHHLLPGLTEPPNIKSQEKLDKVIAAKMSKSKPGTAIFIQDTDVEIKEKLNKAWCPEKQVEFNPVLELVKYIIFHDREEFVVERPRKYGGRIMFSSYEEVEKAYINRKIHPQDLKLSVAKVISEILNPVRKHFEKGKAKELYESVKKLQVTR